MKTKQSFLGIALLFVVSNLSVAQSWNEVCANPEPGPLYTGVVPRDAYYFTEEGSVRTLVVFVQYRGDTYPSTVWSVNQRPSFYNTFIDTTVTQLSQSGNISHYYRNMSFNKLKLYGDRHFVITTHTEAYYRDTLMLGNNAYGYVNKEVLQTLNSTIDYTLYDNWTFNIYNQTEQPDGKVDFIIMFYRRTIYPSGQTGIALLGTSADSSFSVDGKTVQYGFPGSGVTNSGGYAGQSLYSTKHELGHLLFGSGHPVHGQSCGSLIPGPYGFWGIMSTNPHYCITAFERERLRWINYTNIGTGITNANITDFVTTPPGGAPQLAVYRILIPGTSQVFILENHQKLDTYFDDPNHIWPGKGLYIYRVTDTSLAHPKYDLAAAEGDYDWTNPYWIDNPFGGDPDSLPVYKKGLANRNGRDGRDRIPHTKLSVSGGCLRIFALDINGQPWVHERLWGDPRDPFNMVYSQVFSPWSNPVAKKFDNTLTDIAVEIVGKTIGQSGEDIFNLKFYNGSGYPIQASPSKPINLQVLIIAEGGENRPQLTWALPLESDVNPNGWVYIERRRKIPPQPWTAWSNIATLSGSSTTYTDNQIGNPGSGPDTVQYKIRTKDTQLKYSVYSDTVSLAFNHIQTKMAVASGTLPKKFSLQQNYPNPFNPLTIIKYELPVDVHMTLKVNDVLGREVMTLVDEFKQAGYHEVTLDASNLASGIYFYKLTAGSFSDVKKLLLIK